MRRYLDDVCVGSGALLAGVGVWHVWPVGVWFYAGAVLIAVGLAIGRVASQPKAQA